MVFISHSIQLFNSDTSTLTITDPNEFTNDYQSNTKYVIISSGITEIPGSAFYGWTSLLTAEIADSVTSIGFYAFCMCSNLEEVSFGVGITSIGQSAFQKTALKYVTIKSPLTTVGGNVFNECENLESVIFGEDVQTIGSLMFQNCINLKEVTIPSTISSISTNPFIYCNSLQNIKIAEDNSYYSNYENDGVLYDKLITRLIIYPSYWKS